MAGLAPPARAAVEAAEVILGGARHHSLSDGITAERLAWPSPFDAMIDTIRAQRGRRFVVLVTGDPLWYSVGARILRAIPADQIRFHPQISAFQFAACRMGWSLADVETLTVHGRPVEQALPFFGPGARLLMLTQDAQTPGRIAALLRESGFGPSHMTVLGALGGPHETRLDGAAETWDRTAPDFHVLAVECRAAETALPLPLGPGLPDDAFAHDGKITKQEIRALTLARLAPRRHGVLWDIGCGCGSVAVEWLRLARDGAAIGIEPNPARRDLAARNALRLGAPRLRLIDGQAPAALKDLPPPDAIFIGGGLSEPVIDACLTALPVHGRLVANAVTLESETCLIAAHAAHGGALTRLAAARADAIGRFRGWRPSMPVTQWSLRG